MRRLSELHKATFPQALILNFILLAEFIHTTRVGKGICRLKKMSNQGPTVTTSNE